LITTMQRINKTYKLRYLRRHWGKGSTPNQAPGISGSFFCHYYMPHNKGLYKLTILIV
jgi:hypothetical protein